MFLPITSSSEITLDEFQSFLNSQEVVVIKYEAEWCTKCHEIKEMLDQFSEYHPEVKMVSVDIDKYPDIKEWARIKAIPMVIMYKNGRQREFIFGAQSYEKYEQKLQRTLR